MSTFLVPFLFIQNTIRIIPIHIPNSRMPTGTEIPIAIVEELSLSLATTVEIAIVEELSVSLAATVETSLSEDEMIEIIPIIRNV